MTKLKIIASKTSLFCATVEWALKLKGLEYEVIIEDLRNKSELLLKSNPVHKKVPVLLDEHEGDEVALAESLVILEYIDEKWKENKFSLLPEDPYERAQARFWAKFADEKCVYGVWGACVAEGPEKEKALKTALEAFQLLENHLKGKKFFGGRQIGYLDLVAGWIPYWLGVMEEAGGIKILDPEKFPSLHEWGQNFVETPLVKGSLPPREMLLNHLTARLSYLRSLASNQP